MSYFSWKCDKFEFFPYNVLCDDLSMNQLLNFWICSSFFCSPLDQHLSILSSHSRRQLCPMLPILGFFVASLSFITMIFYCIVKGFILTPFYRWATYFCIDLAKCSMEVQKSPCFNTSNWWFDLNKITPLQLLHVLLNPYITPVQSYLR